MLINTPRSSGFFHSAPMKRTFRPRLFSFRTLAALVAFAGLLRLIGIFVLDDFPNSADEWAYLYQAMTFSEGRITNPAHLLQQALSPFYIHTENRRVFSIFPPGWPWILSLGAWLDAAWWVNPLLSALTAMVLVQLGSRFSDRRASIWAAALLLASPMALLNSASLFSHPAALLSASLATLFVFRWLEAERWHDALAAGIAAGFCVCVREFTALLLLGPLCVYALISAKSRLSGLFLFLAGAAPWALAYGFHNKATSGLWYSPPRFLLDSECLGFGERTIRVFDYVETLTHTPADGAWNMLSNLGRLAVWTLPGWLLLVLFSAWLLRRDGRAMALAAGAVLVILGYMLYPGDGGNQYGARFYYEAAGLAAPLSAAGVSALALWLKQLGRRNAAIALAVFLVFAGIQQVILVSSTAAQIDERRTLFKLVDLYELNRALVIVAAPSGDMTQGDLIRNLPDIDNAGVIYAWDLGPGNARILDAFPDRDIYLYGLQGPRNTPFLERIRPRLGE